MSKKEYKREKQNLSFDKRVVLFMFKKIKKVIRWLPVIWRSQDWSYHFLFDVMRLKVKEMEEFFESDKSIIADADKVAKELKTTRILLDRLCKQEHITNALHWYDKKYSEDYNFESDNSDQHKMFMKWAKHSDYMEDQDIEYLFNLMKKKIRWWWN